MQGYSGLVELAPKLQSIQREQEHAHLYRNVWSSV